jgi:hypothetical protein
MQALSAALTVSLLSVALAAPADVHTSPASRCRRLRARVVTISVTPSEQQGTVVFKGRALDGYRVASLAGRITGATPGGVTLDHSMVFSHRRRPAARITTQGDAAVLTPTSDPCVVDIVEDMNFATATPPFDVYDLEASDGEARGTINVCTGENRFDVTVTICRR